MKQSCDELSAGGFDPQSTEENVHSRSVLARARARNRARARRSDNSLRSGEAAWPAHHSSTQMKQRKPLQTEDRSACREEKIAAKVETLEENEASTGSKDKLATFGRGTSSPGTILAAPLSQGASRAALGDWNVPIPCGPEIFPPTEPNIPSDFAVRRDCDDSPSNGKKRPGAGQSPVKPGSVTITAMKSGAKNKDHASEKRMGKTLADEKSNEYRRRSAKDSHGAYSMQEAVLPTQHEREKTIKARTTTQRSDKKRHGSILANKKSNTKRGGGRQATQSSGPDGVAGFSHTFSSSDPMEATTPRTTSGGHIGGMQKGSILANRKNNVHRRSRARASQNVTTNMSGAVDALHNENALEERPSQTPAVSESTIGVDTPPASASSETMSMDYAAPLDAFVVDRSSRYQAGHNEASAEEMSPSHLFVADAPLVDAAVVDENYMKAATCGILKSPKEYVRRNRTCVGATLVVALALIAMVGTLLGIYIPSDDTEGESENPVLSLTSTPSPTTTTTLEPTEERFDYIKNFLTDAAVSREEALNDNSSPQYYALEWLSNRDPLQLSLDEEKRLIQRYVLATFYFSTGGKYWIKNYNFLGSKHECYWFGLAKQNRWNFTEEGCFCSKGVSSGDIDYIHMIKNNLTGTLPSELMHLPTLKVLFLYENYLSGTMPECLGELRSLEQLSLDENGLTGIIPSSLGGLPSLKKLSLYGNQLNGTIPYGLGNLSSLVELSLDQNFLSGHVPEIFPGLTNLRNLYLHENGLTGQMPKTLGKSLELIDLSDNQLSGPIPETFGRLVHLRELYLINNRLNGTLPSALGSLTSLELAFLYDNTLSGKIPETLGKLTSLVKLYLHKNDLTGHIPESLEHLKRLQNLYLFENKISGTVPSSVGNMTSLVVLALYRNLVTGPVPDSLGKLTLLQELNLHNNKMNGTLPAALGNLSSLINLELNDNYFFGHIPASLGRLNLLEYLYLHRNDLSGTIPESLGSLNLVEYLYLHENDITGTIPTAFGKHLASLRRLYLDSNRLTGTIPESLGSLNLLKNLYLHGNELNGTIPTTFGKHLASLRRLYLYSNRLSGTIPASLGNLTSLEKLYVDDNFLNGTFPEEVCNLSDVIIWADCLNEIVCEEPECCDECY